MVVTVTTAFWVRGYCSTGSSPIERRPSTKIVRLTTVARTGRSMKMSVNFLIFAPRSLVLGFGGWVVRRLDRVVDDHGYPRAQLDLPGGDHRIAFLDAREDRDLIAARAPRGDELLLREKRTLPILVLLFLHHEHGVAVGVVGDRRLRQRDMALRFPRGDGDGREHAGQEHALGVADGGAHLDVSRRGVHLRVDRADLARELLPGEGVGLKHHLLLQRDFPERLLRRVEIHVYRIECLQRDELGPGGHVLPEVDRPDPDAPGKGRTHELLEIG